MTGRDRRIPPTVPEHQPGSGSILNHHVVSQSAIAIEHIQSRTTEQNIVPCSARQHIRAYTADEHVIAAPPSPVSWMNPPLVSAVTAKSLTRKKQRLLSGIVISTAPAYFFKR